MLGFPSKQKPFSYKVALIFEFFSDFYYIYSSKLKNYGIENKQ